MGGEAKRRKANDPSWGKRENTIIVEPLRDDERIPLPGMTQGKLTVVPANLLTQDERASVLKDLNNTGFFTRALANKGSASTTKCALITPRGRIDLGVIVEKETRHVVICSAKELGEFRNTTINAPVTRYRKFI